MFKGLWRWHSVTQVTCVPLVLCLILVRHAFPSFCVSFLYRHFICRVSFHNMFCNINNRQDTCVTFVFKVSTLYTSSRFVKCTFFMYPRRESLGNCYPSHYGNIRNRWRKNIIWLSPLSQEMHLCNFIKANSKHVFLLHLVMYHVYENIML
jgi:hypothetical protein